MQANLETSKVASGLENVNLIPYPKGGLCQMPVIWVAERYELLSETWSFTPHLNKWDPVSLRVRDKVLASESASCGQRP